MSDMVERVARAICANTHSGFCRDAGGDLGCKVGRGLSPKWENCIATGDQLVLCGHRQTALAAIEAMREPTDAMVKAGIDALFVDYDVEDVPEKWRVMIDAALK